MKLVTTIVVALDFDDVASDVVKAASKLAKRFRSELVLVHVIEASEEGDANAALKGTVLARLNDIREQLAKEGIVTADVLCEQGKAPVEIVNVANRLDVNLIMLGTRGVAVAGVQSAHLFGQ